MGEQNQAMVIAYPLKDALYLNITNRCSNACLFCIRDTTGGVGYNLWLEQEPTVDEIMAAVGALGVPGSPGESNCYKEIVFCGYGEPLMRPEIVVEVSRRLKNYPQKIRLNTNGLADLFLDYDILPELKGLIDTISISLNAHNPQLYQELTRTKFGAAAFPAVLEFTRRSKMFVPRVILSVVRYPGVNVEEAATIAEDLGVEFRVREFLE
jgi:TatD family-associated radical SAM protein